MTTSPFTREKMNEGQYVYTLVEDTRFHIVPLLKHTYAGSHGSAPVFGRTSSDGGTYVTGWLVRLDGAQVTFCYGLKLAECKAKLTDPAYRTWMVERAEARGFTV